jgi:predicted enzyme related to lactoylglutathione lyase
MGVQIEPGQIGTGRIGPGRIDWIDLTVPDAETVRDFYQSVTGWSPAPVDMGGYSDFCMTPTGVAEPVAGICHARGGHAGLPPVWLIYITVADLDESVARCQSLGGRILRPAQTMGSQGRFCVIQDPAGAVAALYQPANESKE